MKLFPDDKFPHKLNESEKYAYVRFQVMDKGRLDREHWDRIREKLVGLGEDIYDKIKQSDI